MRILVMSDSHGEKYDPLLAVKQQPDAAYVIHLGDGEYDLQRCKEKYPDRIYIQVKGNCDFGSQLNAVETITLGGRKIYITHGYAENVKYGLTNLFYRAKEQAADLVLYGHTHIPRHDYYDEMHVFNPGSIREGRYGVIDIEENGIMCMHNQVRYE